MRYIPAMGQRSASFVCTQSDQNNYTNDLWTHYLIFFIRLSGSFELHLPLTWLLLQWALFGENAERKKGSKVTWQRISASLHPPPIALRAFIYSHWNLTSMSARAFSHLFIVKLHRWEKGSAAFWGGKWLVVNIDCHCWESKRERNERKQVHLP